VFGLVISDKYVVTSDKYVLA